MKLNFDVALKGVRCKTNAATHNLLERLCFATVLTAAVLYSILTETLCHLQEEQVMHQTAESSLHSDTAGYLSDYIIKLADHAHGQLKCLASAQPPQAMSWHPPLSVFGRFG